MFTVLLAQAADQRDNSSDGDGTTEDVTSALDLGPRGVVYICDANYDANLMWKNTYEDCESYCHERQKELHALAASGVACVLLDPEARQATLAAASTPLPRMAFNFTDTELVMLFKQAAGVFVEGGSTLFLLKSLKRPLGAEMPVEDMPLTFGSLIRARVESRTLAYIGVSAGSVVAGETASVARIWSDRGAAALGWNFTALKLIRDCVVLPHFKAEEEGWMEQYAWNLRNGFSSGDEACPRCAVMGLPQCQPVMWGRSSGAVKAPPWRLEYLCPN